MSISASTVSATWRGRVLINTVLGLCKNIRPLAREEIQQNGDGNLDSMRCNSACRNAGWSEQSGFLCGEKRLVVRCPCVIHCVALSTEGPEKSYNSLQDMARDAFAVLSLRKRCRGLLSRK